MDHLNKHICGMCGKPCDGDREFHVLCPECQAKENERIRQIRLQEHMEAVQRGIENSGIPRRYMPEAPYVPFVYDWMMKHPGKNILLDGETGSGKSTSAGVLARHAIEGGVSVSYTQMYKLLDGWRDARRSDEPYGAERFLNSIERADLLIIDEIADKNTCTESTQECMWRLLEDIYNGTCRARVVMLGNLYAGFIRDVFGCDGPARRRLRACFLIGRIDTDKQTITELNNIE